MASLAGEYEVIYIARLDGRIAADVRPLVRVSLQVIVEQDGRREQGSAGGGGRFDYAYFSDATLKDYAEKAVHQALTNLDAKPAPAGTMTVVLGSGWPGILLHEAIGHGLEGDFNRKGSSAFSGRIGQRSPPRASPSSTTARFPTGAARSTSTTKARRPMHRADRDGILRGYMQDS
jgi:TldD protein